MKIYYYSDEAGKITYRRVGIFSFLQHWFDRLAQYVPLVATGDVLLDQLFPAGLSQEVRDPAIIGVAVLLYNALVFCKGWLIGLSQKNDPHWKIVFAGCFVYTFGTTTVRVYELFRPYFPGHWMITATIALWVAYFVYTRFRFGTDEASPGSAWIYKAGLRTSN